MPFLHFKIEHCLLYFLKLSNFLVFTFKHKAASEKQNRSFSYASDYTYQLSNQSQYDKR